ncbi:MAG: small multi-drug export protein [Campylobacterota bacterium]|nr:small multi-drug export protein [Campylobacterota bacterium]
MNFNYYIDVFSSKHGKVLLLGITMVILLSIFIIVYYFVDPDFSNKISAMVVANIVVGRVPSLSLGYASGLSHFTVISTNVYIEMVMVALLYSAFIFSYNNIIKIDILDKFFKKIDTYKDKYSLLFDRYGVLGLFVFVFIPFWMTGPIVGAIIGYLLGMRHFTVISIVFISTILAMSIWGLLLNELIVFMNIINSSFVWFVLVISIVVLLIKRLRNINDKQ